MFQSGDIPEVRPISPFWQTREQERRVLQPCLALIAIDALAQLQTIFRICL